MARLFIVAFLGKPRTDDAEHAKEVPPIMWVPLAILGFLALFSAYGPISETLQARGHADFGHFFGHFGLTAILSLAGLVLGVFGAWKLYAGRDADPVRIPLFANKFYFDEIYLGIVRVCQDFVAMLLDSLDKYVIEPLTTRLPAMAATGTGYVLRLIQVGNIQGYAFLFAAGVVALIWFLVF
jgi:NADH-quinone oxidoreductase subunit L